MFEEKIEQQGVVTTFREDLDHEEDDDLMATDTFHPSFPEHGFPHTDLFPSSSTPQDFNLLHNNFVDDTSHLASAVTGYPKMQLQQNLGYFGYDANLLQSPNSPLVAPARVPPVQARGYADKSTAQSQTKRIPIVDDPDSLGVCTTVSPPLQHTQL